MTNSRFDELFEGPARLVRPQTVSEQRNQVGAHVRIGNEVAVAEEVCCPADLDDVDRAQQGNRFDLVSAEGRRDDPPEPGDAAGQLIEIGSHEELLQKEGRYAELFRLQAMGYQ